MGKRRGKKSRAKKVDDRLRLRSLVRSDGSQVVARNLSDVDAIQSRERPRPSSPGIFGAVFRVMVCSVLCLLVTWLVLWACLAVPDREVVPKMFKGIGEQAYNQGATGSVSILAGIATIALTLRGMSWRSRELPADSSLHRAWLQKVIDDSAREGWAFSLLVLLSGLYGAVVVTYGIMSGYNGWPGISRVLLIFLSVMYVVVAALPAFVPKSDIGTVKGYVETLVRVANLGELRYFNFCDSALSDRRGGALKFLATREVVRVVCVKDVERWWYRVVRFSGLCGVALIYLVPAMVAIVASGSEGVGVSFGVILFMIVFCLGPEVALVWMLKLRCQIISAGKTDVGVIIDGLYVACLSVTIWSFQLYVMPGPIFKSAIAVLCSWWSMRALLVLSMKSECRRLWPSRFWERLSVAVGLRCVAGVWVNQALQESRNRLNSYCDVNLRVVDEFAAAASLVIPEGCVVSRVYDGSSAESVNLRNYLSEVVKVTLPPVPKSVSGAGK